MHRFRSGAGLLAWAYLTKGMWQPVEIWKLNPGYESNYISGGMHAHYTYSKKSVECGTVVITKLEGQW